MKDLTPLPEIKKSAYPSKSAPANLQTSHIKSNSGNHLTVPQLTQNDLAYPNRQVHHKIMNFQPRYKGITGKKPQNKHAVFSNLPKNSEKWIKMNKISDRLFKNYKEKGMKKLKESNKKEARTLNKQDMVPHRLYSKTAQQHREQFLQGLSKKVIPPLVRLSESTANLLEQGNLKRIGSTASLDSSHQTIIDPNAYCFNKNLSSLRRPLVLPKVGNKFHVQTSMNSNLKYLNKSMNSIANPAPNGTVNYNLGQTPEENTTYQNKMKKLRLNQPTTSQASVSSLPEIQQQFKFKVEKCDYVHKNNEKCSKCCNKKLENFKKIISLKNKIYEGEYLNHAAGNNRGSYGSLNHSSGEIANLGNGLEKVPGQKSARPKERLAKKVPDQKSTLRWISSIGQKR